MTDEEFIIKMKDLVHDDIDFISQREFWMNIYKDESEAQMLRDFEIFLDYDDKFIKYCIARELSERLTEDKDRLKLLLLMGDYLL